MSFLENFLSNHTVRKDPASKQCVEVNKWDQQTQDQILDQVKDYVIAAQELGDKVDTGWEAMSDTLMAMFKAAPKLRDSKAVRPSYLINLKVVEEMFKLKEFDQARRYSVGDPVATGLAAAAMEPELEILFDKMKKAQSQASAIEGMLSSIDEYSDEIDDLIERAKESPEDPSQNYQEQIELIEAMVEALKLQVESGTEALELEIDNQVPNIKESLTKSLEGINEDNEALEAFSSWGLSAGSIKRMSPRSRLELAEKLKTRNFKKMAEIIGRMQNVAFSEHLSQSDYAVDEVYELERGNDLGKVIPTELLALNDDILIYDWLHRFVERSLVQYSLIGKDSVVRGGILALLDSSSSMSGERAIWAKAIALALLKIAKIQKRPFDAIEFSGPGNLIQYNFDTSSDELKLIVSREGKSVSYSGAEAIIAFAEGGLSGGTCFMTPLSKALDVMSDDFNKNGGTSADIVFLTDGQAGISSAFLQKFKNEQERLGFQVFGIAVGGSTSSEPIGTLCDGKVTSLKNLTDENDLRPIFNAIGG